MMRSLQKEFTASIALVVLAGLLFAACDNFGAKTIPIGAIIKNPAAFEGQEIKIRGEVTQALKVPFIEVKLYFVSDDTGTIPVLTEKNTPALHSKVTVKGQLDNMAIMGDQGVGAHLKEVQRF